MDQIVKNWLNDANETLEAAEFNLDGKKLKVAAFLAQQSAEKALKAVYIQKYKKLIKTHDLKLLAKKIDAPKNIRDKGAMLTPFETDSRYPDFDDKPLEYSKEEVEEALSNAEDIVEWVKQKIKM